MISTPRSTSQRLRQSASKTSSGTPAVSPRMRSTASMMSARRSTSEDAAIRLEHEQRRGFDALPQHRMQARPRHDVGLVPENPCSDLLHIHELEKPKLAALVIEEQIDIRIRARLTPRGRAEHVQMLDAEPLELGLMRLQSRYGLVATHRNPSQSDLYYSTIGRGPRES